MTPCTAVCWTPVQCTACGNDLPPRGRAVPAEFGIPACCDTQRMAVGNRRHLWTEHDATRKYTDPDGWATHQADCMLCGRDD